MFNKAPRTSVGHECSQNFAFLARSHQHTNKLPPVARIAAARRGATLLVSRASNGSSEDGISGKDLEYVRRAVDVAGRSIGISQPHPNAGCVLVSPDGHVVSEAFQVAQGTTSAEAQAVSLANGRSEGSTAYINLEPGDCHGDNSAVQALVQGGVERVVIGLKHPLPHLRGQAIKALAANGVMITLLEESRIVADSAECEHTLMQCLNVNEPLIHRVVNRKPFSVLKYAMTLDGKIATAAGHAAWVSASSARQEVFRIRAASDAIIVGGQTVRQDNPRLTTRRDEGHIPTRVLLSRTLDLPEAANLWDTSIAPTIVMTQKGARRDFQSSLHKKGVEVVEFDFLTPSNVAEYCYERGFMQCLWECGGELAAPAISQNVINKVVAFVAPKIIGGVGAPTPCGDLGFVEMTQAVPIDNIAFSQIGTDIMVEGYLPSSGGLQKLHHVLTRMDDSPRNLQSSQLPIPREALSTKAIAASKNLFAGFYKCWDTWGSFSNFSPHPIWMQDGIGPTGLAVLANTNQASEWPSVEHYYQAQKFAGVDLPDARQVVEEISNAESPEEAARLGRSTAKFRSHLLCPNWEDRRLKVMMEALRSKFSLHEGPRQMLIKSAEEGLEIVELSPHDYFWGCGADGSGENNLGKLLMKLRSEIINSQVAEESELLA